MKRWVMRALLVGVMCCVLGTSSCTSNYTVSYGYTGDPYGEVFYRQPIDQYGFYGHP
ncbi:MAG: hypothetical protein OER77_03000 [Myxococcales bacterium]|nr:hypothetical protein [Myxococcales bacterium]